MPNPKTYVPKSKAKVISTKYGAILKLGFHVETLAQFCKENVNAKGWINFDVSERREPDDYGNTHSVALNDYEASAQGTPKPAQVSAYKNNVEDDMPF